MSLAAQPRLSRAARQRRRRRRLAGLARFVVFVLIVVVAVWAGVRVAHAGDDASLYTGHAYEVQAGDSLWSIAAGYYSPSVDVRQAVYDIRQVNHLAHTTLQPGDTLMLPYEEE